MLVREKYIHLYINNYIQPNRTPIEPIIKDIRINKNQYDITKKNQFGI